LGFDRRNNFPILLEAVRSLRKEYFAVPDPSLVGCGTVPTVKRRLSARKYCFHFQDRAVEVKWIFFFKLLNLVGFITA
jgi:hypothetical protein